jgi:hypothetical protein
MSGSDVILAALTAGSPAPTSATVVRVDVADEGDRFPFVVFRRVDVQRDYGLGNVLLGTREVFEIECWGKTRDASEDLEAEVIDALAAADLPVIPNDPDALDPTVKAKAVVVRVEVDT